MIECHLDLLNIELPEVDAELRQCGESYVTKWLPKIMAEDPRVAVERALVKQFPGCPKETIESLVNRERYDMADLERRFRDKVLQAVTSTRAKLTVAFERTLRVPDDKNEYPFPPGLGWFPLRSIEQYTERVPQQWVARGGVLMPMYQAEALWIRFTTAYPFAVKVATGLINVITGQRWTNGLPRAPQGYIVLPEQLCLHGYNTKRGVRQFVAARLGAGYTAEEQIFSGAGGGIQIEVFPVRPDRLFEKELQDTLPKSLPDLVPVTMTFRGAVRKRHLPGDDACNTLGMAPGGRIKQEMYEDPWEFEDWDLSRPSPVWVHVCDASRWRGITKELPPQRAVTAEDYSNHGLPWFDYYRDDLPSLQGSDFLARLKSIFSLAKFTDPSIPQEGSVVAAPVTHLRPNVPGNQVREWHDV